MYMYMYIKFNMIVSIWTTRQQLSGVIVIGSPSRYFYYNTYNVYPIQFQMYVHACKCVSTMHLNVTKMISVPVCILILIMLVIFKQWFKNMYFEHCTMMMGSQSRHTTLFPPPPWIYFLGLGWHIDLFITFT